MKLQDLFESKYTKEYCSLIFQQYAFGEYRHKEDDTKTESEAFRLLFQFVKDNRKDGGLLGALEIIKGCRPHYPEFQPKAKIAYRTTFVPLDNLPPIGDFVKLKGFQTRSGRPDVTRFAVPYRYQPKGPLQSFTVNRESAFYGNKSSDWRVTLECAVDDDFIMSADFMNLISSEAIGKEEFEIIRLSTKPIDTRMILSERMFTSYIKHRE